MLVAGDPQVRVPPDAIVTVCALRHVYQLVSTSVPSIDIAANCGDDSRSVTVHFSGIVTESPAAGAFKTLKPKLSSQLSFSLHSPLLAPVHVIGTASPFLRKTAVRLHPVSTVISAECFCSPSTPSHPQNTYPSFATALTGSATVPPCSHQTSCSDASDPSPTTIFPPALSAPEASAALTRSRR